MVTLVRMLVIVLIALTLSLSGAQAGEVLQRGVSGEPDTLDPHKMKLLSELTILRDLFEGLTKSDAKGNIIPGAAESWEVSADSKVYTFHLREGLKWSDGHPLTAPDFVAGYRRLFDPATAAQAAAFLYTIKNARAINAGEMAVETLGVSAPDDRTVVVELRAPNPVFPTLILSGYTSPFPRHVYAAVGEDWVKASNLVSNGAFFLKEWVPHDRIELDRNPHYHNVDNVALSKVIFHPLTDEGTAMKRFRAGELDIAGGVPIRQMEYLSKILPGQIRTFPDMAAIYLVPNMDVDGLNDVRVRKALSLATDRRALTEKVLKGMGIPAFRFTPPNVSHYDAPGLALKDQPMAERLDQARALLAQAGYGPDNPLQFQLRTTDSESARSVVVAVRSMWQQVGVDAQIYSTEVKTHYADLSRANFEMAVATYYGWDDPNEFLSLFTAATGQMSFNYGRYNNPKFDTTLDQALEIADIKVRHQKMADAEQIMLEDLAVIPIFYPVARTLVSNKLENYLDNSLNVHPSEYLSLVNGAEAE